MFDSDDSSAVSSNADSGESEDEAVWFRLLLLSIKFTSNWIRASNNVYFSEFQTEIEVKMGQSQNKGLYSQIGGPIDDEIDQPESFVQTVKTQGQQQVLR